MIPYWVRFKDGTAGCLEAGTSDTALSEAERITGKVPERAVILPYPAKPLLARSYTPAFCRTPNDCGGLRSCPRNPACSS